MQEGEEGSLGGGVPDSRPSMGGDDFSREFDEPLERALDLDTWRAGGDLAALYGRLEAEVAEAVRKEGDWQKKIREKIFPQLRERQGLACAGVWRAKVEQVEGVHQKLLFNGGVEACDGIVAAHDTLPVTITQIGVCLTGYQGDQGSWVHRLFRRDLRGQGRDPVNALYALLERRRRRSAVDEAAARDRLSDLARRGIMAYAERAVLMDRSNAVWRMGHGNPTPYELLTGSGMAQLAAMSIRMFRRMVELERFVFVPSSFKGRQWLTIGNALQPLEYAILETHEQFLGEVAGGHYRGEGWGPIKDQLDAFIRECGPKIVRGLYRASRFSPCQAFYAHVDHAHEAALIALADSVLQEHRGFPMLIDLADNLCKATFGMDAFTASMQVAYSEAGAPFRYMSERRTR
jgi:hypothetical protein